MTVMPDDDLVSILASIENESNVSENETKEINILEVQETPEEATEIPETPEEATEATEEATETPEEAPETPEEAPETPEEVSDGIDLNKTYNESVNELLTNYRQDRTDINTFIQLLYERIDTSNPSRVYFEALSASLRTRSESNSNLIKLLDLINKRTSKSDNINLEELLSDEL